MTSLKEKALSQTQGPLKIPANSCYSKLKYKTRAFYLNRTTPMPTILIQGLGPVFEGDGSHLLILKSFGTHGAL